MRSINAPDYVTRVDRSKYEAMRAALLAVLPDAPVGMTAAEAKDRLLTLLPQALFPEGAKAMWWMKTVQLDLEARGLVKRMATKPLRFHRS